MTIEDLFRRAARILDKAGTPWAIVGGWAVSIRSEPRFTRDLDLAVAVMSDDEAQRVANAFVNNGYQIAATVEQDAVNRLATVRLQPAQGESGILLDLLFASSGIEPEICSHAERTEILPGLTCPVARPEHLLALKILARDDRSRPQDAADIQALLQILTPQDVVLAREALELIARRGFHRDRDLVRGLDDALIAFRS